MTAIDTLEAHQKLKSHEKLIEDLRHYCVNKQAKLELLNYKITCYRRLLESEEVTMTDEGKRQKRIIDTL